MKLSDLMPEWVNYAGAGSFQRYSDSHSNIDYHQGDEWSVPPDSDESLIQADGILFLCPVCYAKNGGPVGTESVLCWFANRPHIPADAKPGPGRWIASGSDFNTLTLTPSVNVSSGHWHGFIRNGEIC